MKTEKFTKGGGRLGGAEVAPPNDAQLEYGLTQQIAAAEKSISAALKTARACGEFGSKHDLR
jgi:hypothetical protein